MGKRIHKIFFLSHYIQELLSFGLPLNIWRGDQIWALLKLHKLQSFKYMYLYTSFLTFSILFSGLRMVAILAICSWYVVCSSAILWGALRWSRYSK